LDLNKPLIFNFFSTFSIIHLFIFLFLSAQLPVLISNVISIALTFVTIIHLFSIIIAVEIQRTLNQLGTPQDSPELRQQLQQKQQYTNQLAKETDKYIKEFGSLPTTPSEQRQRKIQKDRLVAQFTTSLTNFQKVQREAAEKEKEFVARVRASSRVSGGFPEDTSKERNLVSWESQAQPQVQVQDEEITEDDLRLIHERESSIRQLEADIMDINEIFKDLGMMIHEQGDVIDSIEANVENAEVHVQQANQQLSRAAEYQCRFSLDKPLHPW
uniref:Syntaxin-7 n=1 Tax=Felis catus TaxID=9685 RepID=A0ABI7XL53_FELCA